MSEISSRPSSIQQTYLVPRARPGQAVESIAPVSAEAGASTYAQAMDMYRVYRGLMDRSSTPRNLDGNSGSTGEAGQPPSIRLALSPHVLGAEAGAKLSRAVSEAWVSLTAGSSKREAAPTSQSSKEKTARFLPPLLRA